VFLLSILFVTNYNAQTTFQNLNQLLEYSEKNQISLKNNELKIKQAQDAIKAAKLALYDPQFNINAGFTNNLRLPVSVLPGEPFGGAPGSSRELSLGTKYNTSSNQSLDIRVYNPTGKLDIRLAELNADIVDIENKLSIKSLQENIATTYYNIIQLKEQLISTNRNIVSSKELLNIVSNKYNEGLVKQQDMNEAKVNLINLENNAEQILLMIQQNYIVIKKLADITEDIDISESVNDIVRIDEIKVLRNELSLNNLALVEKYKSISLQKNKLWQIPSVSFVLSNSFNTYNQSFKPIGGDWVTSNYFGLKLNFNLPNAQSISKNSQAKFEHSIAQSNLKQNTIQNELERQNLELAYKKAIKVIDPKTEILNLYKDTYVKNENLYKEGLISMDKVIQSKNNEINAEYDLIASKVTVLLAQSKVDINNKNN
jgi:outer membrane protein